MVSSYNLQPIQFNNQGLEKKNTFTFVKRQKRFEKQRHIIIYSAKNEKNPYFFPGNICSGSV